MIFDGQRYGSDAFNEAWTLHTDSAGGWLAQHYHRVIGQSVAPTAAVLSPDGRVTFAIVPVHPKRPGRWHDVLRAYQTTSGRLSREILTFPVIRQAGQSCAASPRSEPQLGALGGAPGPPRAPSWGSGYPLPAWAAMRVLPLRPLIPVRSAPAPS